ncbi:MAG: anthranilate synthase component I [Alphaproteobacteria bacterium]
MRVQTDFAHFASGYEAGRPQAVWSRLVADLETPVSAMLKLADGRPFSFLLESVEGGAVRGRYSIIGLKPDVIWRCYGDRAEINRAARFDPDSFVPEDGGSIASLRRLVRDSRIDLPERLPPMASALVGYMGYEMVRLIERLPTTKPQPFGLPDGLFVRPTVMAIFDNVEDSITIVTPVWVEPGLSARTAYNVACERLADVQADLERALPHQRGAVAGVTVPEPESNTPHAAYVAMVRRAKEYIAAGDVFQVVLSQRFAVPFALPPFALYRALRRVNPSPFLFFLDFGAFAVVGSSPEILVRARDGKVTIRPIAGTRRRGADRAEDEALAADLLSDPKELAEHLMLLDLGRNDVGKVARIGTVKVTERNVIEYYSHVMHIVSNVVGVLDPRYDGLDALMAGFPHGTVSGAPKVRAMEIIDELEVDRRGIYAGAVGYFSANGTMDSCIALRTAVVKDGVVYIQAGGGIVADSTPEAEDQECRNKARALVRAIEVAMALGSDSNRPA